MLKAYELPGVRNAMIDPSADVHPTAEIGNPPEHRQWWQQKPSQTVLLYGLASSYFHAVLRPQVRVGPFVTVDGGIKHETVVGERTWLLAHSHVGHDARIGVDCEVSTGAIIGGHCTIGNRVRIGLNATIKPFVSVGDDARIGMGAVVTRDVPAGETWVGCPAMEIGVFNQQRSNVVELEPEQVAFLQGL